ncbi:hypothetical protein [Bilophila wadsworthia]
MKEAIWGELIKAFQRQKKGRDSEKTGLLPCRNDRRERWRGRCADRRILPLLEVLVELSRMANYIFISKSGSLSIEFM